MPTEISGVLKDGMGNPIPGCTIELKATHTSKTVVAKTVASQLPERNGSYNLRVEYGKYRVTLRIEGYPPEHVGDIYVDDKSEPGTLNDFLGALTDADLRPEAVKRFEAMAQRVAEQAAQVEKDKSAASGSAERASQSQAAAASSADDAATQAKAADGSAKSAAQSAQAAKVSEDNADKSQTGAKTAAQQAELSRFNSQQCADDALEAVQAAQASAQQASDAATSSARSANTAEQSHVSAENAANAAADSAVLAANAESSSRGSASAAADAAALSTENAAAAERSEKSAKASEIAAAESKTQAANSAEDANQSALAAAKSAALIGEHESTAAASAKEAKSSEEASAQSVKVAEEYAQKAKSSEDKAAQALADAQLIAKTPGASAYEVWVSQQSIGQDVSIQAYLAAIKGAPGDVSDSSVDAYVKRGMLKTKNLNDLQGSGSSGIWLQDETRYATKDYNYPENAGGRLQIINFWGRVGVQIYTTYTGNMYIRSYMNGDLQLWSQMGGRPTVGGVGTYVFAQHAGAAVNYGVTISAVNLKPACCMTGGTIETGPITLSGAWMCLGNSSGSTTRASLFIRVA